MIMLGYTEQSEPLTLRLRNESNRLCWLQYVLWVCF